jgi:hypothetical protein
MKRKKFIDIMSKYSNLSINNETAWEIYLRCVKSFKNTDKNSVEYLKKIGSMSQKEKLVWRTRLAESGIEITPSEIDDYILIISLVVMKNFD